MEENTGWEEKVKHDSFDDSEAESVTIKTMGWRGFGSFLTCISAEVSQAASICTGKRGMLAQIRGGERREFGATAVELTKWSANTGASYLTRIRTLPTPSLIKLQILPPHMH